MCIRDMLYTYIYKDNPIPRCTIQMQRIGISGKMCSGKTNLAQLLVESESRFTIVSFADPIYNLAREYFGMEEKDRGLLIHIGESFRAKDPNVWIRAFMRRVVELEAEGKWVLVDDLRLAQEHAALRENGFKLVRLNVSEYEQENRLRTKYPTTYGTHLENRSHSTECDLDHIGDWDVYATENARADWVRKLVTLSPK